MSKRTAIWGHSFVVSALCLFMTCFALESAARAEAVGTAGTDGESGSSGAGGKSVAGAPATVGSSGGSSLVDTPIVRKVTAAFKLAPTETVRGGTVILSGTNLPADKAKITIWLDDFDVGHPASVAEDRQSLAFVVPNEAATPDAESGRKKEQPRALPARSYVLSFSTATDDDEPGPKIAAGLLQIMPERLPPVRLESMSPTIVYPDTAQIVLTGLGLGGRLRDYALLVDGTELNLCPADDDKPACSGASGEGKNACCTGLSARFISDHQLVIYGSTQDGSDLQLGTFRDASGRVLTGDHVFGLRSGDSKSSTTFKVAFSPYKTSTIRYGALAVALLLLVGMVLLVTHGGHKHYVGSREFVGKAFLIDVETDTYSLSKLQFYMWSSAALFAYTYLSLSRCLVQGKLDIADIPPNLPSILGLSAATAVTSVGIAKLRGPKAAGVLHPSFPDLLGSGGVVSPERFTLLLWTIVAIATFLLNVWNVDSMVLNDLPKIPDGLLALSGVSSLAYLGGKFARGAGPVIDEVLKPKLNPDWPASATALELSGRQLDLDATFEVDGRSISELLDRDFPPKPGKREDGAASTRYAKSLTIVLSKLPERWKEQLARPADLNDPLKITIVNGDGQRAEAEVPLSVLSPSSVPLQPESPAAGVGPQPGQL